MPAMLAQRLVALAAVSLLAAVATIAITDRRSDAGGRPSLLGSGRAPTEWNTAFVGSRGPVGDAQRTTCGHVLTPQSLGVAHPVLPCGARIVLRNDGTQVLTEVIDNALVEPGLSLEVTEELARILGIENTVEVEWRFAPESSG